MKESRNKELIVYQKWLPTINWTFIVAVTTKYVLTSYSARRLMDRLIDRLRRKVFKDNGVIMFWSAEEYNLKEGRHIHMLLEVPNGYKKCDEAKINKAYQIVSAAVKNREYYRTDIQKYNPKLNGARYVAKDLYKETSDFDIL